MKVEDRLDAIEKEIADMKTQLSSRRSPRVVKLKGLLKGLSVDPSDLEEAKKVTFQACVQLDRST